MSRQIHDYTRASRHIGNSRDIYLCSLEGNCLLKDLTASADKRPLSRAGESYRAKRTGSEAQDNPEQMAALLMDFDLKWAPTRMVKTGGTTTTHFFSGQPRHRRNKHRQMYQATWDSNEAYADMKLLRRICGVALQVAIVTYLYLHANLQVQVWNGLGFNGLPHEDRLALLLSFYFVLGPVGLVQCTILGYRIAKSTKSSYDKFMAVVALFALFATIALFVCAPWREIGRAHV